MEHDTFLMSKKLAVGGKNVSKDFDLHGFCQIEPENSVGIGWNATLGEVTSAAVYCRSLRFASHGAAPSAPTEPQQLASVTARNGPAPAAHGGLAGHDLGRTQSFQSRWILPNLKTPGSILYSMEGPVVASEKAVDPGSNGTHVQVAWL